MVITDPSDLGVVLGVWAHPDDETWLSAGLMAGAVLAGNRVGCVTATRGELGSQDPERWPVETLGAVRERELEASLAVLGVEEHWWFDYPDGGCAAVDPREAAGRIAALMEQVRPDSVLTFAPDGLTGHDDHMAISRWTSEAFASAAPAGASLYHAATSRTWAERWVPRLREHNVYMKPGTPVVHEADEIDVRITLTGDLLERKVRAIGEHVSQIEGLRATFGDQEWHEAMAEETFVRTASR